jgi:ribosomal-protein-alanine N-acetyltransferase
MVARALKNIQVGRFGRRDLKRVIEIELASFGKDAWPSDSFLDYLQACPSLFLVARIGRLIAGYSITTTGWRGAEIESIAVDPKYRGRGVAGALLDSTVQQLDRGIALRLMVDTTNDRAVRFYRRHGFVRSRLVKSYYGPGRDGWRMRLERPQP